MESALLDHPTSILVSAAADARVNGTLTAKSDDDEALVSAAMWAIGETPTHAGVVNAIEDFGAAADGRGGPGEHVDVAPYADEKA